ncbi:MAG TPA: NAD(P)-dependent oxidoreductase [Nitrospira sp.]|nr:NAD(P)-dependent oxidoreductase [Nitrospira sp.]
MMEPKTYAVIGAGLLGRAIAERLHAAGESVIVYNRTPSKALPLQAQGITVVERADQAIGQADCSLLLLSDAAAIRSVLLTSACATALRGKLMIQMGTIGVDESVALQTEIARLGGHYCEAPVLGSLAEAKAGMLLVMVGATEPQFQEWSPLFRLLSREPRLIGSVGKAAALKLALNHLIASETAAFALSLGSIQRSGVPVESFMEILRESALYAPTFDKKLSRLTSRDYSRPNFSVRHLLKDLDLFLRYGSELGLATIAAEGIRPLLRQAIERGLDDEDYSAIFEVLTPRDGAPRAPELPS